MKNLILSLMLIILFIGCTNIENNIDQGSSIDGSGRVVFAITDASANMETVTSVKVKVDSVKVHSEIEGWVDVTTTPQEYDLLQLKDTQALLADISLKDGNYTQLRLDISNVVVTDDKGEHEAKLPSGEIKMNGDLSVKTNTTSTATFDFILDESLHITGNGKYILAPVIQLETRENADVEIKNNKVEIKSGEIKTNVKLGMDLKGDVGIGLGIAKDDVIDVDASGGLKLGLENRDDTKTKSDTSVSVNNNLEINGSLNTGIY